MVKVIVSGPQEMPVRLDSLVDFEDTLVSGELTSDGIGYSEEAGTEDAGVVITPFSRVINR